MTTALYNSEYKCIIEFKNLNVNTSDMAAGIYFLNFSNGAQSTTKRFVVAK